MIRINDIDHPVTVLERGGNFCIQIYESEISREDLLRLERDVSPELGGSLDGVNGGSLALSIPSTNGIEAVNQFFGGFKRRTGIEWYYGNIYKDLEDTADETLLNWWVSN